MIYAGIGPRKTPKEILDHMTAIGERRANAGDILRSGGANGADSAFELGCDRANGSKEIYLPWQGFNGKNGIVPAFEFRVMAEKIARDLHPAWGACSDGARKLLTRNVFQMLGENLATPADCVITWIDPNEKKEGGTGFALRVAKHFNIPIFMPWREER